MGEDRDTTIIRLEDCCPKFQDGPKAMVRMTLRDASNQSYFNSAQDLTLDAGHRNPGAVGLRFVSSNVGGVRNTLIRCPDRAQPASVGLDLTTGVGGLGYIRGVRVEGLRKGVEVGSFRPAHTFENLELFGQQEVGFENADLSLVAVDRIRDGVGEGPNAIMVRETSRGETRALRHASLPRRWPDNKNNLSVVIPLYRSTGKS